VLLQKVQFARLGKAYEERHKGFYSLTFKAFHVEVARKSALCFSLSPLCLLFVGGPGLGVA
jgi:hypothetical protein